MTDRTRMKRWCVETKATVARTYFIDAVDEVAAKEASRGIAPDLDEDEDETTVSITEVATDDDADGT